MMILPSGIDDDDDDDCEDDSGGDFCWRLGGRAPKAWVSSAVGVREDRGTEGSE